MRIPDDFQTRGSYLETEFELFHRADLRLYHHVNGLFVLFLARDHPVFAHPLRASARLVYTEATKRILSVTGKKRKGSSVFFLACVFVLIAKAGAPRTEPNTVLQIWSWKMEPSGACRLESRD